MRIGTSTGEIIDLSPDDQAQMLASFVSATSEALPTLSRKQLRNGLLSIGVTAADVEGIILAITDPVAREEALIDWQDTQAYERNHPLIIDIAASMDLPSSQVDDLWLWAASR